MARKRLSDKELREHINAQQKSYRERNPELTDLWRQRSYAKFLTNRGWKVTPPEGMQTSEQIREERDIRRQLEDNPIDLSDLNADENYLPW